MLIRLDFLKLETDHLVFFLGAGADFFQQLKLDILRVFSESIYFLTIKSHFYLRRFSESRSSNGSTPSVRLSVRNT